MDKDEHTQLYNKATPSSEVHDVGLACLAIERLDGITISGDQLAEEVYPSIVFFQDTYSLNIQRIFLAGLPESTSAAAALRAQTEAEVRELVSAGQLGTENGTVPKWRMAGVVGALLS